MEKHIDMYIGLVVLKLTEDLSSEQTSMLVSSIFVDANAGVDSKKSRVSNMMIFFIVISSFEFSIPDFCSGVKCRFCMGFGRQRDLSGLDFGCFGAGCSVAFWQCLRYFWTIGILCG